MPEFNWQLGAVIVAVGWAAWHVTRRARASFRAKAGAPGCGTCPTSCAGRQPLVTLDPKSIERDPEKIAPS